jgi:hypothetical protein
MIKTKPQHLLRNQVWRLIFALNPGHQHVITQEHEKYTETLCTVSFGNLPSLNYKCI